ncbi:MAG: nicotinate-nucleotide adenylyltransferase [Sphingobacteriales bacterium]|jgi:nicotinate-nucleotide adenylyltransferase
MSKTGLFFGSFNPIHIGHLALADHIQQEFELDEVCFVVSPQNPLKPKSSLLDQRQRLHMVNLAIESNPKFRSSDVEFYMPLPSYTADTLAHLEEKFPEHEFHLIMGEDSLKSLPKWKNFDVILERYPLLVYPRIGDKVTNPPSIQGQISYSKAPVIQVSSSFIRQQIKAGKSAQYLLPREVFDYLEDMGFYF